MTTGGVGVNDMVGEGRPLPRAGRDGEGDIHGEGDGDGDGDGGGWKRGYNDVQGGKGGEEEGIISVICNQEIN